MGQKSKRNREIATVKGEDRLLTLNEAIDILKNCPPTKFDQSVELSMKMGVDPRKSDQNIRGTVSLPNGTGKNLRVLVFAMGEKEQEALKAGADFVGSNELAAKILAGWVDFDAVVATPDMMREVGKLGKVLGPRGLMPSPKAGSVTTDVATAVKEVKAGKIEFKLDRHGVINNLVGKLSFEKGNIVKNIQALVGAVVRAKPPTAKGTYIHSFHISSTMGPGLKIDAKEFLTA